MKLASRWSSVAKYQPRDIYNGLRAWASGNYAAGSNATVPNSSPQSTPASNDAQTPSEVQQQPTPLPHGVNPVEPERKRLVTRWRVIGVIGAGYVLYAGYREGWNLRRVENRLIRDWNSLPLYFPPEASDTFTNSHPYSPTTLSKAATVALSRWFVATDEDLRAGVTWREVAVLLQGLGLIDDPDKFEKKLEKGKSSEDSSDHSISSNHNDLGSRMNTLSASHLPQSSRDHIYDKIFLPAVKRKRSGTFTLSDGYGPQTRDRISVSISLRDFLEFMDSVAQYLTDDVHGIARSGDSSGKGAEFDISGHIVSSVFTGSAPSNNRPTMLDNGSYTAGSAVGALSYSLLPSSHQDHQNSLTQNLQSLGEVEASPEELDKAEIQMLEKDIRKLEQQAPETLSEAMTLRLESMRTRLSQLKQDQRKVD